jgi:predicted metalloenzyme YecM
MSLEAFYIESRVFVERFNAFAKKHALDGVASADHICYKCDSAESFEQMRAMFEGEGSEYMYQSIISKRRIAVIKLARGIETALGVIYFLELSDQKPDGSQKNSFDHIEIYPLDRTYDELVQTFEHAGETVTKVVRPHHTTHDIDIGNGFLTRLTEGPLIEKITREEMR